MIVVKDIKDEDFINYKKPSMFIAFPRCSFKCEKECGVRCCQNSALAQQPDVHIEEGEVVDRYIKNNITSSIVIGGMEPFDTVYQLIRLIDKIRERTPDDIIIYTGYNKEEVEPFLKDITKYKNIVIKFGRFIPNQEKHYDEVLGVYLASDNQYAERIS